MAHLVLILRLRRCAGLWWPGLSGIDSHAGRKGGYAERHRAQFHPVQSGRGGGPGIGRFDVGAVRREVVLRPECTFISGTDYFTLAYHHALPAQEDHGVDVWKS